MKRFFLAIVLLALVIAAVVVAAKLGVFEKSPTVPAFLTRPGVPMSPAASPYPPFKPVPAAQIAALMNSWTYPGAKPISVKADLPGLPSGKRATPLPKYMRCFAVLGPPARVYKFYSAKLGMKSTVGTGYSGALIRPGFYPYLNGLQTAAMPSDKRDVKENGAFTHSTSDYIIDAILTDRIHGKRTQVVLLMIPYANSPIPSSPPPLPALHPANLPLVSSVRL